ncbi:type I-E CRISPR-associated endoribonuclease Cas2e [Oecophyllibacter saccharovorans]|uniref:Type I-E CRISPR-associated endoribonuclease Cas2 n=1 Tax=Oecophyllibacter saccharovorans TaxID=2558360 RepID=A0A506URM8_9PROT|nr:type I-E CRISPR-associated endoribonuclease Cas2e [Oecophyllibacter saccharovorans]TPW36004.1 type I-E CRISPR-associated endoribonuclease Cas2 [Oecophyllibacter saccharovorans]
MPMTIIVTHNVEGRYRGYLTSIMLEVSAGVYIAPRMTAGVRERTWLVMTKWYEALGNGTLLLAWPDKQAPSGVGLKQLGVTPREIIDVDGVYLLRTLPAESGLSVC